MSIDPHRQYLSAMVGGYDFEGATLHAMNAPPSTAQEKLQLALEMHELGCAMMRQNLLRRFPHVETILENRGSAIHVPRAICRAERGRKDRVAAIEIPRVGQIASSP